MVNKPICFAPNLTHNIVCFGSPFLRAFKIIDVIDGLRCHPPCKPCNLAGVAKTKARDRFFLDGILCLFHEVVKGIDFFFFLPAPDFSLQRSDPLFIVHY